MEHWGSTGGARVEQGWSTGGARGNHVWNTGGAVDKGSIPVLAVSCGLSLLLALSLIRGFFSGVSGFPPSIKTNTSKFQFDLDVERLITRSWLGRVGDHSLSRPCIKYLFIFVLFCFTKQIKKHIQCVMPS